MFLFINKDENYNGDYDKSEDDADDDDAGVAGCFRTGVIQFVCPSPN